MDRARVSALERLIRAASIVVALGLAAAWWARVLARQPPAGATLSVHALLDAHPLIPDWAVAVGAGAVVSVVLLVRRSLLIPRVSALVLITAFLSIAACLTLPFGQHVAIVSAAVFIATSVTALYPAGLAGRTLRRPSSGAAALAAFLVVASAHAFFSMHRHAWFGSGSWDAGCMVHNWYRTSRFLEPTSTVLGDVDFLGDHFMIGLYLFSPIAWIDSSAYALLGVQAASLAAVAPVVFLLLEGKGAPRSAAFLIAVAAGLAFGMQSAAYFDIHEITVGLGFLALAVLFLERRRLGLATAFVVAFSLFKESLGAYVVGLGLLLLWRGIKQRDRRHLAFGAAWVLYGAVWFVLVNRVFMPALIARASRPEPHETFADFGPTVFSALVGITTHPVEAVGAIFVPPEKLSSLLVTFGGLGFLALARPELVIAALPLFAERFLSSKTTMWEMGYHYGAPLTFYSAWAVAVGWPRLTALSDRALGRLSPELHGRAPVALTVYVLASTVMVNAAGYRHPSNYHRLREDYFSTPERRASNAAAVAFLEAQGRDAKLAVQNRMLPHLADRPYIWRLAEYAKADFVLLNVAESAWPYDDGLPRRLAAQLAQDPAWRLIFSAGETAVFARVEKTSLPAVPPAPQLGVRASHALSP